MSKTKRSDKDTELLLQSYSGDALCMPLVIAVVSRSYATAL